MKEVDEEERRSLGKWMAEVECRKERQEAGEDLEERERVLGVRERSWRDEVEEQAMAAERLCALSVSG